MQDWSRWAFPVFIMAAAVGLMAWHTWVWRRAKQYEMEPDERNFRWRQYRRRIQIGAMLGLLAAAMFAELWIRTPTSRVVLVLGMLVLVFWVAALALADFLSTRQHFARLESGYRVEQAKLEAEARRLRSLRGNGKPDRSPRGAGRKKSK